MMDWQEKVYLKEQDYYPQDFLVSKNITPGNWYVASLTPTIYDTQTLKPADPSYIITCDDGKMRKMGAKYFLTLEEYRQQKLNELGI
jgi:hypothetical protein